MPYNLKVILLAFCLFCLSSCSPRPQPEAHTNAATVTQAIGVQTSIPSPSSTPTTPTSTPVPPTPTVTPTPTYTTTPAVEDIRPFRGVASMTSLPVDLGGYLHVRALADGSVWIITRKEVMRWDGRKWQVVLDGSKEMLADVDDSGRVWVLYSDRSDIEAWKGGDWIIYGGGRGWTNVDPLSQNGWAATPWSVYTGMGGKLWVPMVRDVRVFDGNRWDLYTLEDMGFPIPEMEEINIVHNLAMVDRGAEVWVGECYYSGPGPMGGGGVRWFDGQAWQGADAPVGSTCVSAMEVDSVGNVWLGAYTEIWHYEHATDMWTEYGLPKGLLADYNFAFPQQITVDQAGDAWVIMEMCGGASCGVAQNLYRIHNGQWSLVLEAEDWSTPFKQLALDGNGRAWLFWEGKLYQLNDQPLEPIASIPALGVDESRDGSIWVVAGPIENTSLQVMEP